MVEKIVNVYHTLKKVLEDMGCETGLGDEGGFAPNMKNSEEALKALHESIVKAGYKPGEDIGVHVTVLLHTSTTKKTASTAEARF